MEWRYTGEIRNNSRFNMSDQSVAAIARELAEAMLERARSRLPEDQKKVLFLQTQLVQECAAEIESGDKK